VGRIIASRANEPNRRPNRVSRRTKNAPAHLTERRQRRNAKVLHSLVIAIGLTLASGVVARAAADRAENRIVSLTPAVTEILFAMGAGPEVVGVSQYCDFPPAAEKLPQVGSFLDPNLEAIVALRPNLIVSSWLSSDLRAIRTLNSLGYPTLIVRDDSLEDIRGSITQIGVRIGRSDQAAAMLEQMNQRFGAVRERLAGVKPRSVLMIVGHEPMIAVGSGTFLDQLIKMTGAINIADAAGGTWPRLSIEYIIARRPEVILDGQMGSDASSPSGFWRAYPMIPAVRNHHVYGYPEDRVLQPGPRVDESFELIAERIYPELWPELWPAAWLAPSNADETNPAQTARVADGHQ
jgi:iron complex transport system substrate-binding protein